MKKYSIQKNNVVIDGETKYLNLKPVQGTAKMLAIDAFGNLGTSDGGSSTVDWADITGKPATFAPTIGTTATTAKAGNYVPTYAEITGKPATFAPTIGTTATTAKAGNYTPTSAEVSTALKAKAQIAALTETSTAAEIVAALKA